MVNHWSIIHKYRIEMSEKYFVRIKTILFLLNFAIFTKICESSNSKIMLTRLETSSTQYEGHTGTFRNEDSGIVYVNLTYERKVVILSENVSLLILKLISSALI